MKKTKNSPTYCTHKLPARSKRKIKDQALWATYAKESGLIIEKAKPCKGWLRVRIKLGKGNK